MNNWAEAAISQPESLMNICPKMTRCLYNLQSVWVIPDLRFQDQPLETRLDTLGETWIRLGDHLNGETLVFAY